MLIVGVVNVRFPQGVQVLSMFHGAVAITHSVAA